MQQLIVHDDLSMEGVYGVGELQMNGQEVAMITLATLSLKVEEAIIREEYLWCSLLGEVLKAEHLLNSWT